MKISKLFTVAVLTLTFAVTTAQEATNFIAEAASSTINWKGYKPTGSHHGTIALQSGNLTVQDENIIGSFTVDMGSIKDADGSAKLEGHLKSADFFDVAAFPIATFEITNSTVENGKTMVTGDITIKGITKQITFLAVVTEKEEAVTLTSETFQINRAEFNIKYKSKSFFNNLKEKFINDEFDLQVSIVAKK